MKRGHGAKSEGGDKDPCQASFFRTELDKHLGENLQYLHSHVELLCKERRQNAKGYKVYLSSYTQVLEQIQVAGYTNKPSTMKAAFDSLVQEQDLLQATDLSLSLEDPWHYILHWLSSALLSAHEHPHLRHAFASCRRRVHFKDSGGGHRMIVTYSTFCRAEDADALHPVTVTVIEQPSPVAREDAEPMKPNKPVREPVDLPRCRPPCWPPCFPPCSSQHSARRHRYCQLPDRRPRNQQGQSHQKPGHGHQKRPRNEQERHGERHGERHWERHGKRR